MKRVLVLAAASALMAGCALDPKTAADTGEEKEYRTGSNIPAGLPEFVMRPALAFEKMLMQAGVAIPTGRLMLGLLIAPLVIFVTLVALQSIDEFPKTC